MITITQICVNISYELTFIQLSEKVTKKDTFKSVRKILIRLIFLPINIIELNITKCNKDGIDKKKIL